MEFKIATTEIETKMCDDLLTKLIQFEAKIDTNINSTIVVKDCYKNYLNSTERKIFIATQDNQVVGFCPIVIKTEKTVVKPIIFLQALFVEQNFRHQKVATRLIETIENWAKENFNNSLLELEALNNNTYAFDFYRNLGFAPIRTTLRKNVNQPEKKNDLE